MKKWMLTLIAAICLLALPAFAGEAISSMEELSRPGIRVGISQGSAAEGIVQKQYPQAELVYFLDNSTAYLAVAQGKIDAYVFDVKQMRLALESGVSGVHLLEETLDETVRIAVGISPVSKIPDLQQKLNRFIGEIRADGTLDDMFQRWVMEGRETMPEIPAPEAPGLRLTVGTTGIVPPYSYYVGTERAGMDIELAYRFAAWLGADLEFRTYDYGSIIAAAAGGDVDCIMANLNVTPERAETLPFSDLLYEEKLGVMVRGEAPETAEAAEPAWKAYNGKHLGVMIGGILEQLSASFEKTFLREERWRLFLEGVKTTLLITLLSILFGTAAGFGVYMLCRNGNPLANRITRICIWLVQGTPMVVLLMILYYVVFGSLRISGAAVAVIGFTLTFGSAVFGLLKMGVGAVDPGQHEAACALGHSRLHAFFRIVLPQAIPHVMPAYQGEITGLIKATAIVGYIAVQDLTKMGDIVRSRTYEAFFPLIAITLIYFALEGLFSFAVRRIRLRIDPRRRKPEQILKGIRTGG